MDKSRTFHITALLIGVVLTLTPLQGYSQSIIAPPTLQSIVQELQTPKEIAKYLRKNFKFTDDQKLFGTVDYWQAPEEFLNKKKGDCEDYALMSKYLLDKNGYESLVVSIYGIRGYAHTVTIYKEDGKYNVMNEDRNKRYKAKSIEKAISKVYGGWTWAAIAKRNGTRGWMIRKLTNASSKKRLTFRENFADFPF